MFSEEHQTFAKSTHGTSEGKPLYATENMAQDIIDEKPFSWLELPEDFSTSSNKRLHSDDEESINLDDTHLLTSRTTDFITTKQIVQCETNKVSTSTAATMENIEGLEPSAPGQCRLRRLGRVLVLQA